jgi:hypothetical protein
LQNYLAVPIMKSGRNERNTLTVSRKYRWNIKGEKMSRESRRE